ncbi:hypothetical protein KSW81_008310 [Nannochloris sp. 'desiccata']|nr:hypothetical protein KSW81_008310 [Chlorella desiccata (nom. nud.)]
MSMITPVAMNNKMSLRTSSLGQRAPFQKIGPAAPSRVSLGKSMWTPSPSVRHLSDLVSDQNHRNSSACSAESYSRDLSSAPRLIQHKNEAKIFYMFLSQVYDYIVNPGHWTVDMRDEALLPAKLDDKTLKVVDVGGGTGFCTQGIVQTVDPTNVTLLDQSPHQLAKARKKSDLQGVTILEGDAEDLPFETDSADRYVSAGSIEYWPEPQRGICEAYRVVKPGGGMG